jgi:serine protease inhibitor
MAMTRYLSMALPFFLAGALGASGGATPGLNHFATASYRELARGNDNLIFSPFSVSAAVSMLLDGARGQTARQMAAVLHQVYPDPKYQAQVASLEEALAKAGNTGANQLLIANGLWVQRGFAIQSDFKHSIETLYHAPLTQLDFLRDPEQARAEINSWTGEHTKGKILELYPAGSLDPSTRLVLTSAIYFYRKWQSPFHPQETRPEPFHLGAGGTVNTNFMNQTGTFGYAETPSIQVLEMRYAGTPLAFDVLLPKANDGLRDLEKSLTPEMLSQWLGALQSHKVEVGLPKFRAESQFSLRDALSQMGMPDAFTGAADFSGIDDRRDLTLSDVLHKAFVDVSEEGTEAAAATGGTVTFVAMLNAPRKVFRADHPFAFLIRDAQSGVILFEGRLATPKS